MTSALHNNINKKSKEVQKYSTITIKNTKTAINQKLRNTSKLQYNTDQKTNDYFENT